MLDAQANVGERLALDIKRCLTGEFADAKGEIFLGVAESKLAEALRDLGWRRIPAPGNFDTTLRELGFSIVPGFAGKWTRGGFKHVQPARVVTLQRNA